MWSFFYWVFDFLLSSGGSRWSFHLQVVDKTHLRCFQPAESSKILVMGGSGQIPCPGLNCSDNTDVIWYKERHKVKFTRDQDCLFNNRDTYCKSQQNLNRCFLRQGIKAVAKQHRNSCEQNGWLHLCPVRIHDSGVYFCDRQMSERGVKWTFRRAVNVTVVRKCCVRIRVYYKLSNASYSPIIYKNNRKQFFK